MTEENKQLIDDLEKRHIMLESITKESSGVEKVNRREENFLGEGFKVFQKKFENFVALLGRPN